MVVAILNILCSRSFFVGLLAPAFLFQTAQGVSLNTAVAGATDAALLQCQSELRVRLNVQTSSPFFLTSVFSSSWGFTVLCSVRIANFGRERTLEIATRNNENGVRRSMVACV